MTKHLVTALALAFPASLAHAQTSSSFFTNDHIGDGHDRWRSGGYTQFYSFEPGAEWDASIDIRLRSEILSPWGASDQPADADRPYAGMLGFGLFLNDYWGPVDYNLGIEVLFTGDMTGVQKFQESFHETFGFEGHTPQPGHDKLENDATSMLSAELARKFALGNIGAIRPFMTGKFGYESFMRTGVDVMLGNYDHAERYVRDPISGFIQPSSAQRAEALEGVSLVAGVDYTYVLNDYLITDGGSVDFKAGRTRTRLGVQAGLGPASIFYGATHLSEEFEGQVEGQTLGTISVEFTF
jgi:hypothetical protein